LFKLACKLTCQRQKQYVSQSTGKERTSFHPKTKIKSNWRDQMI
jgi:hypothetical protein